MVKANRIPITKKQQIIYPLLQGLGNFPNDAQGSPMLKPEPSPKPCHHRWVLFVFLAILGDGQTSLLSARPCCSGTFYKNVSSLLIPLKNRRKGRSLQTAKPPLTGFWSSPGLWGCLRLLHVASFFHLPCPFRGTGPVIGWYERITTASPLASFHWLWRWPWSTRQWRRLPDASNPPSPPHEYFHTKFPRSRETVRWDDSITAKRMVQEKKNPEKRFSRHQNESRCDKFAWRFQNGLSE